MAAKREVILTTGYFDRETNSVIPAGLPVMVTDEELQRCLLPHPGLVDVPEARAARERGKAESKSIKKKLREELAGGPAAKIAARRRAK